MPNLNEFKAQLKRGYSKKETKNYLSREDYPQTAVAKAGKINEASRKALSLQSIKILILVIGIIIYAGIAEAQTCPKGTYKIYTSADSFVYSLSPSTNYGNSQILQVANYYSYPTYFQSSF